MGFFQDLRIQKYAREDDLVKSLIDNNNWINDEKISEDAASIVSKCRKDRNKTRLDNFFLEYGLSNHEGVALMCLAESLLRIPDNETCDDIINEKIGGKKWSDHFNQSPSIFVNATTFGLFVAEQVVELDGSITSNPLSWLKGITSKFGDPVLREAIKKGMEILSEEFVSGIDIEDALEKFDQPKLPCSFDMLGEAARTQSDVDFFFSAYENAIKKVGEKNAFLSESFHEISIKLSAIHPRYELLKKDRVMGELYERVLELSYQAANQGIALTIDAEEQDRLELSLLLIEKLAKEKHLSDWNGLGLAIQAYGKRSPNIVGFVDGLGQKRNGIMMRLVKGAYWDQEIKIHQTKGAEDLPVFTSKSFTDLNYLHTANFISKAKNIRPYFATHNAHTVSAIMHLYEGKQKNFEFQRIFGMGDLVFRNAGKVFDDLPLTRIYAPVGSKKELLPYLVRRLLENGANSSFVNKYLSHDIPVDEVVKNPIETAETSLESQNYLSNVKRPNNIFGSRVNSKGFDFSDLENLTSLQKSFKEFEKETFHASTLIADDNDTGGTKKAAYCPGNTKVSIGSVTFSDANIVKVLEESKPSSSWGDIPLQSRKDILYRVSESLNLNRQKLFYLLSTEAGKTIKDCDAEVREAIDFIHYYISESEKVLKPLNLPGPSGENNFLSYEAKGNFLCISPWNFPLAIFVGQIAAALLTGNNVIAKPAEDTSIVAYEVVKMFHDAGVSTEALQLIIADKSVSNDLTKISWLDGIAFTGSGQAAKKINLNLANSEGPIKSFIAETGGLNVMFVDSSALKEQVIDDIIKSAFLSAGQRCSALRVVYIQDDVADEYWDYLIEAMQELSIGDPILPETDIGPIINKESLERLREHSEKLKNNNFRSKELKQNLPKNGYFFKPVVFEINDIKSIDGEKFGPILHFIRYKPSDLESLIEEVNATGYGLTMGAHTRITGKAKKIFSMANVGNFYLNRDIVGAVVGVQPFGGHGLSGTGPKAGGPNYLKSFLNERTFTDNVMATGGNIDLLNKDNQ